MVDPERPTRTRHLRRRPVPHAAPRRPRLGAASLAVAFALGACSSSGPGDATSSSSTVVASTDDAAPVVTAADTVPATADEVATTNPPATTDAATTTSVTADDAESSTSEARVIDLVLVHRYAVVGPDGEEDLAPSLVRAILDGGPTVESWDDGVTFSHGEVVAGASFVGGERRDDVEVVVGVVADEESETLAVLLAPEDGADPIGGDDSFAVDLGVVADSVSDGDVVSMDLSFNQAPPILDEPTGAVARFTARAAAGEVGAIAGPGASAGEPDGDDEAVFEDVLGEVVVDGGGPEGLVSAPVRQADPTPFGDGPVKPKQPTAGDVLRGFKGCRGLGLKCLKGYFKNLRTKVVPSVNGYLDKNLEPTPEPTPEPPAPPPGGSGQGWGDPHLRSFDGAVFDLMAVGEFHLVRSDEVEVQIRTVPVGDSISVIDVVAVETPDVTLQVGVDELLVDGEPVDGATVDLTIGDTRVVSVASQVTISDGTAWVQMGRGGSALDVVVATPAGAAGLLGDADGDPDDDPVGPDGEAPDGEPGSPEWQRSLGDLWRIDGDDSLFVYGPGETTETFTDRSLPADRPAIDAGERERAETACRLGGVEDPVLLQMCVLDVVTLGLSAVDAFDLPTRVQAGDDIGTGPDEEPDPDDELPTDVEVAWGQTPGAFRGFRTSEEPIEWFCPALDEGTDDELRLESSRIWGTGVYTDDSRLCLAAVHDGVLDPFEGGAVTVLNVPPPEEYVGSTANGVTSSDWGAWSGAYRFVEG